MVGVDLHTHTRHSDGTTTPEENVASAAAAGLVGVTLTDHDTVAGWEEAAAACSRRGLMFVPGVELSTERAEESVHLLGYWVEPDHAGFVAECTRLRDERSRRARAIVERLAELGVALDWEALVANAGSAPIGRPHIARALVTAGAVPDLEAAFAEYLRDGGPAWVPKHALDPVAGVRLIRAAGGAAVLAHPGSEGVVTETLADELVVAGLAGVEASHPRHDAEVVASWTAWARERELVVTGGSDFHGDTEAIRIGDRRTDVHALERLRASRARNEEAVRW